MHLRFALSVSIIFMMHGMLLFASSGGITGRSVSTSGGCGPGGCHGSAGSPQQTTLSIKEAVGGVVTVAPNTRVTLTLSIAHSSQLAAGFNLSVRSTAQGGIRVGTLDNNSDSDIRAVQGEVTHGTPKTMSGGTAEFTFGWTSPEATGEYYIHAIGNAVNRNSGADGGDRWAYMTPVKIVVTGTSSVSERTIAHGALSVAPVPAHSSVVMSADVAAGEEVVVQVLDAVGNVIRRSSVVSNEDHFVYVWDGRTNNGTEAAPGSYTVAIIGDRRVWTGKAVIVR